MAVGCVRGLNEGWGMQDVGCGTYDVGCGKRSIELKAAVPQNAKQA